jgi:hypothetical protein
MLGLGAGTKPAAVKPTSMMSPASTIAFGLLAAYFVWLNWKHPMDHAHHGAHHAQDHA